MQHLIRDIFVLATIYLIASGTLVGQARDDLMRKYGQPRSETFTIALVLRLVRRTAED